jgi:hypothetical protein
MTTTKKQSHPETVCEDLATWIEIFNEIEPPCPDPESGRCWCHACPSYLEAERAEREHHENTRHRPTDFGG